MNVNSWYKTYYKVFSDKGVSIDHSKEPSSCFSSYNFSGEDLSGQTIEIYVLKDYGDLDCRKHTGLNFTFDEIKRYIDDLKDCSFTFSLREEDFRYVITAKEDDYVNLSHVRCALDFVRLVWEKDINLILKAYLSLDPGFIRKHGTFVLLQVLSRALRKEVALGHKLPSLDYGVLTMRDFMDSLKSQPNHHKGSLKIWYESEAFTARRACSQFDDLQRVVRDIVCPPETKDSPAKTRARRFRKIALIA